MSEHIDPTVTLLKMVNQIAANLSAYPPAEAADRIAQHLTRFWAPKMRQDLIGAVDDGADISPLGREAISILKANQQSKQIA